jgi:hypothetical protein
MKWNDNNTTTKTMTMMLKKKMVTNGRSGRENESTGRFWEVIVQTLSSRGTSARGGTGKLIT